MEQSKKTILHIVGSLKLGGAEKILSSILATKSYKEQDIEHIIICLLPESGIPINGATLYNCNVSKSNFLSLINGIIRAIYTIITVTLKHKPDSILAWLMNPAIFSIILKLMGKKIYWTIHGEIVTKNTASKFGRMSQKIGQKMSYYIPEKIIYCSQNIATQHEEYGFNSKASCVVENGIDTNEFYADVKLKNEFRDKYKFQKNDIIIGWLARYHPVKDPFTFIKSISQINNDNVKFIMGGSDVDNNNQELKKIIESVNMTDKIILIGRQNEPVKFYNGIDIFCISSINESGPLSAIEAKVCDKIVISTKVGIWQEKNLIDFACDVNSPEHMFEQIEKSINNKSNIKNNYNPKSIKDTIDNYIKTVN